MRRAFHFLKRCILKLIHVLFIVSSPSGGVERGPSSIGIVEKALASHSQGQDLNPTETHGWAGGFTFSVIQVYGRPTLYGGAFKFFLQ